MTTEQTPMTRLEAMRQGWDDAKASKPYRYRWPENPPDGYDDGWNAHFWEETADPMHGKDMPDELATAGPDYGRGFAHGVLGVLVDGEFSMDYKRGFNAGCEVTRKERQRQAKKISSARNPFDWDKVGEIFFRIVLVAATVLSIHAVGYHSGMTAGIVQGIKIAVGN